jgi:hypothetical protein
MNEKVVQHNRYRRTTTSTRSKLKRFCTGKSKAVAK